MAELMFVVTALEDGSHSITKAPRGAGLRDVYDAIGCSLVEVASRGTIGGVPVALRCDEEGLLVSNPRRNLTAADVRAVAESAGPRYDIVGNCVLVHDDELRGFTDAEVAKIEAVLNEGGFPMGEEEVA